MDKLKKHIIFWVPLLLLCCIGFSSVLKKEKLRATLKNKQYQFVAGDEVILRFDLNIPSRTRLYLYSSYGATLLVSDTGDFEVPKFITKTKGMINYVLLNADRTLFEGKLWIAANTSEKIRLESYIGPPSIIAGGEEYTMPVVIPTDMYDNPLPDSTSVTIRHQFMQFEKEKIVHTKDIIAWNNIHSYSSSGRLLIASEVRETSSKEFSIDVFPSLAQDFEITSNRKHAYADGNQITEFVTSTLRDSYGNTVSDGTIVQFVIQDTTGMRLQTQASTINGRAMGKILHPDNASVWKVKGVIPGIAESNELQIDYKPVISDFEIQFTNNNRNLTIGPLLSFMKQRIPDGALVSLKIFQENKLLETKIETSFNGNVKFFLEEGFYDPGMYDIEIEALGVHKVFKKIQLR